MNLNTQAGIAVRFNNECSNNSTPSFESNECGENTLHFRLCMYRGSDKSLARPGRK